MLTAVIQQAPLQAWQFPFQYWNKILFLWNLPQLNSGEKQMHLHLKQHHHSHFLHPIINSYLTNWSRSYNGCFCFKETTVCWSSSCQTTSPNNRYPPASAACPSASRPTHMQSSTLDEISDYGKHTCLFSDMKRYRVIQYNIRIDVGIFHTLIPIVDVAVYTLIIS